MDILGINAYHGGASACLISDGELVAAAEEERFQRVKYWAGFPTEAIRYCLEQGGITAHDLDHVAVSRNPSANLMKKVVFALSERPSLGLIRDRLANAAKVRDPKNELAEAFHAKPSDLKAAFHNIEHHRAHLASAFFVSPFDEAAILSVDGMGDFVSTMWGRGHDNSIEVLGQINYPHSLGYLYTALTQWLGFPRYGDEGKTMGLTAYGDPVYVDEFRRIVRLQRDGTFELDMDYFNLSAEGGMMTWENGRPELAPLYSHKLVELFGPARQPTAEITEHHQNAAASLQAMLEEAEFNLVRMLQRATGHTALGMSGGVALNSVFNGKVLPNTDFEEIYIHSAAGDAGTALGAAYWVYHQLLGHPRTCVMDHAYTGPRFRDGRIAAVLEEYDLAYETLDDEELIRRSAELVARGNVVGWFQGRMEWGPRALGNRSIIADPRSAETRDVINARIKHREPFRPFAPSILLESVGDYFNQTYPDPFMIKVYEV
ncbi:MAG: carbamoyltransferase, partial [bacterium]